MGIIVGRGFQFLGAFLVYKCLLSLFSATEYGTLNLFITISSLTILLSITPFTVFAFRFVKQWEKDHVLNPNFNVIINLFLLFTLMLSVLSLIVYFIFSINEVFILFATYTLCSAGVQTIISILGIIKSVNLSVVISNVNIYGCLVSCLVFTNIFGVNEFSWIAGQITFQSILALGILKRYLNFVFSVVDFKKIVSFVFQNVTFFTLASVSQILFWLLHEGQRLIIIPFTSLEKFGLFSAGYMIARYFFAGFETLLSTYAVNNFYRRVQEGNAEEAWPIFFSYVLFYSITFFGIVFIGLDMITPLILNNEYLEARQYVIIGILCELFRVIGVNTSIASQYTLKPMVVVKPLLITLGLHVFFLAVLLYFQGFDLNYYTLVLAFAFLLYIVFFLIEAKRYNQLKAIKNLPIITAQLTVILIFIIVDYLITTYVAKAHFLYPLKVGLISIIFIYTYNVVRIYFLEDQSPFKLFLKYD